jgi:hypothetical protein
VRGGGSWPGAVEERQRIGRCTVYTSRPGHPRISLASAFLTVGACMRATIEKFRPNPSHIGSALGPIEWPGRHLVQSHIFSPTFRKLRSPSESAARHAIPRSLSMPSKYPISSKRKYRPGARLGRPHRLHVEARTLLLHVFVKTAPLQQPVQLFVDKDALLSAATRCARSIQESRLAHGLLGRILSKQEFSHGEV